MRGVKIFGIIMALVLLAGCGHDDPGGRNNLPERDNGSENPSGVGTSGERPGVSESNGLSHELDDDVWRVSGPSLSLRYDRGGVLINVSPVEDEAGADRGKKTYTFIDLDGVAKVEVMPGDEQSDSTLIGSVLIIDGSKQSLGQVKMVRRDDDRTWYEARDRNQCRYIFCMPK